MKHITEKQRYTICEMKKQGYRQKDIDIVIDKYKSLILMELKLNHDKRSGKNKSDLAQ